MGYPGDHGHSGGRRPAGTGPQDEAPLGGANPYSFPALGSGEAPSDGAPPPAEANPFGEPGPFGGTDGPAAGPPATLGGAFAQPNRSSRPALPSAFGSDQPAPGGFGQLSLNGAADRRPSPFDDFGSALGDGDQPAAGALDQPRLNGQANSYGGAGFPALSGSDGDHGAAVENGPYGVDDAYGPAGDDPYGNFESTFGPSGQGNPYGSPEQPGGPSDGAEIYGGSGGTYDPFGDRGGSGGQPGGPYGGPEGDRGGNPYTQVNGGSVPLGAPVGPPYGAGSPNGQPSSRGLYGPQRDQPGDPDGQATAMFGAEAGQASPGLYARPGGEQDPPDPFGPGGFGPGGENPFGPGGDNPYGQFGQPGALSGGFGPPDGNEPRGKKTLAIVAVGAAVVLVGGGVFVAMNMGGGSGKKAAAQASTPAASAPSPPVASASPSPAPTGALEAKLKSQATDPEPLTIAEVFKNATFKGYKMTGNDITTKCGGDVHGTSLVKAVKTGGCTQVLRATYITANGKLMGTIGVVNLSTQAAAKKAQKAANSSGSWLVPLAGSGATKKISGKAASLGGAEVRGHYLILSWVQRPDGKAIGAGQKAAAAAFTTQVPLGSNLYSALQYRGISGKPYGA